MAQKSDTSLQQTLYRNRGKVTVCKPFNPGSNNTRIKVKPPKLYWDRRYAELAK